MNKINLAVDEIEIYSDSYLGDFLRDEINMLEGVQYSLECISRKNSYQLISDFDQVIENNFINNGAIQHSFIPSCNVSIEYDFSLEIGGSKVVFEIEKANKEKLLYDILKMHVYLEFGVDAAVLVCPKNWIHSGGSIDIFAIAKERLKLCKQFRMADPDKIKKILIVGFTQTHNGKKLGKQILKEMKNQFKEYLLTKDVQPFPSESS